jgi:hypothetical protein
MRNDHIMGVGILIYKAINICGKLRIAISYHIRDLAPWLDDRLGGKIDILGDGRIKTAGDILKDEVRTGLGKRKVLFVGSFRLCVTDNFYRLEGRKLIIYDSLQFLLDGVDIPD